MEGVPGPKVQIQNCYMKALKNCNFDPNVLTSADFHRVTEASVEKLGHRE